MSGGGGSPAFSCCSASDAVFFFLVGVCRAEIPGDQIPPALISGAELGFFAASAFRGVCARGCVSTTRPRQIERSYTCIPALVNTGSHRGRVILSPSTFPRLRRPTALHRNRREPGMPLFTTLLIYLDAEWRREWDAETLFLDAPTGTGVFVRPRGGRAVMMDQDVTHRISTPSQVRHGHPCACCPVLPSVFAFVIDFTTWPRIGKTWLVVLTSPSLYIPMKWENSEKMLNWSGVYRVRVGFSTSVQYIFQPFSFRRWTRVYAALHWQACAKKKRRSRTLAVNGCRCVTVWEVFAFAKCCTPKQSVYR